ncbi:PepSY-associated TM helix domain-containing protein [Chromobacterium phragmitis]|uniref:PepSY-associated TM helix domain-containing protein n=1 Tax=Chromobacterium phragmitis TaxID=2202141 RepID=A0ABV0IPV1_9NEIS
MKRYLILSHRYLGLGAGLFLLLIAISGSLLVFRPELETLSGARPPASSHPVAYQALADAVLARYPGASFSLRFGERGDPILARLRRPGDERRLWLDPASGRIASDARSGESTFDFLLALHEKLLLGEAGEALAGACGLLLAILAVSGLVYWWPKAWRRAFQLRRNKGARLLMSDLHRLSGALASLLLLSAGLTGAYQAFNKPINNAINRLYGYHAPAKTRARLPAQGGRQPLDALVARAAAAMPGARLVDIRYEAKPDRPLLLRWKLPGELHPNGRSQVEVDPYSGALLRVTPVDRAPPAIRLTSWIYGLHTGSLGGDALRALLALAGAALAFLAGSGSYQWAARKRKQRGGRKSAPAS